MSRICSQDEPARRMLPPDAQQERLNHQYPQASGLRLKLLAQPGRPRRLKRASHVPEETCDRLLPFAGPGTACYNRPLIAKSQSIDCSQMRGAQGVGQYVVAFQPAQPF